MKKIVLIFMTLLFIMSATDVAVFGSADALVSFDFGDFKLYDVEYSPKLNVFAALGNDGKRTAMFISNDGEQWMYVPLKDTYKLQLHHYAMIWNPIMEKFIILREDDKSKCITSEDGINWVEKTIGAGHIQSITWDNIGQRMLICRGNDGSGSKDFYLYTSNSTQFPLYDNVLSYTGKATPTKTYMQAQYPVFVSDGQNSIMLASREKGNISIDGGKTWNPQFPDSPTEHNSLATDAAYSAHLDSYVIAYYNSYGYFQRKFSITTATETDIISNTTIGEPAGYVGNSTSVCIGNGTIVFGTDAGKVYKAAEAGFKKDTALTEITGTNTKKINAIAFGDNKFVAVGDGAVLCFSSGADSYKNITGYVRDSTYEIGAPVIKDVSGNATNDLIEGNKVNVSTRVENGTREALDFQIITAHYDYKNNLQAVACSDAKVIPSGYAGDVDNFIEVPSGEIAYMTVFFLNGIGNLKPLCNTVNLANANVPSLKEKYADYFPIGTAVKGDTFSRESDILKRHFSSLTAEGAMKWSALQPTEGVFDFAAADEIVNFAVQNGMRVRGHTFVWHSAVPDWVFEDEHGQPTSRELLLQRMKTHITTVLNHFKGKVYCWDVVNEAVTDEAQYRTESKWYKIIGEDYIKYAFQYAHEADPDVKLYYNDYSLEYSGKRAKLVSIIKELQQSGVHIDGVGMQSHISVNGPTIEQTENAINDFAALGLEVEITELDISVYPYGSGELTEYTPEMQKSHAKRYGDMFALYRKYKDVIKNVTFWGISDKNTWLNIGSNRVDAPLLFDRNYLPKTAYWYIADFED